MQVTNKAESWRIYRDELERQASALLLRLPAIVEQADAVCRELQLRPETQLYLTGSGDSYIAAVSCQYAYRELTRLPTSVVEAFEVAPYLAPLLQPEHVVLNTSISGKTTTAHAALASAQASAAQTILITNHRDSPAAALAKHVIVLDLPSIDTAGFIPSTLSYLGGMIAQYALALELAARLGRLPNEDVTNYYVEIEHALINFDRLISDLDPRVREFVDRWGERPLCIVGGGPCYGTALFGAAKIIESALTPVTVQHVEEWAHIQRFLSGPDTPSVFLAGVSRCRPRMLEIMRAAQAAGTEVVAIADGADAEVALIAAATWPVPPLEREVLQPIICSIPMELLAYWRMVERDVRPFNADLRPINTSLTMPPN